MSGDRPGVLPSAGYIPYSGVTPPSGISGRLAYLAPGTRPDASLAGKLVLVELPTVAWTGQAFRQSAAHVHDPQNAKGPKPPYARPFQRLGSFIALLDGLQAAGAAGVIVILDTPSRTADGLYAPHDGVVRQLPGVFIDRAQGQRLRERLLAGTAPILRLTMAATVRQAQTRNLIGIIPGKSEELMVLASHTDGPHGLDDNGPNAIVDMAQYLARLPQGSLPRSVMLLLTSGHFAGGVDIEQFFKRHQVDGLTQRMAAMLAIEHLGALGEDPYFQSAQPIPTLHYMAQPYYLLDHGIDTTTQLDYRLMQRQILALTQMLLDLSRVPSADLRKETAP